MTALDDPIPASSSAPGALAGAGRSALLPALLRLARPTQWLKGAFIFVGPLYGGKLAEPGWAIATVGAFLAFAFASSACYVINDLRDREQDRAHPRKRNRPLAAGTVSVGQAWVFVGVLGVLAGASHLIVWGAAPHDGSRAAGWVGVATGAYVGNVLAYSLWLKHRVIADVISLAIGFVIRVLAGCAAVLIEPTTWLLNVTLFLAMFLAFGKRLGERRTMGGDAATARRVQMKYTDHLLQMAVVVTGVATLLTYAGYVQSQEQHYQRGFNLLWLTMLPATYGLLRCIVQVERGLYDDPTELAVHDRPFQLAAVTFGLLTIGLHWYFGVGLGGPVPGRP
jgi:4-hydroxybenzoate polyprenyltransferase